ncbi:unnamed protein product [Caenorhabditis auriculariae]|uniref:Uncharacterized protein n=1 Tax=Caenorhabditis auriculariae TaxID=2777116 RepID=A0A8S1GN06_9PELO|nr:unnamed protein product [Caenorhabditis auriculariae]
MSTSGARHLHRPACKSYPSSREAPANVEVARTRGPEILHGVRQRIETISSFPRGLGQTLKPYRDRFFGLYRLGSAKPLPFTPPK